MAEIGKEGMAGATGMSMEAMEAAAEAAGAAAMAANAAQIATENLSELVHDATVGQGAAVETTVYSQGTGEPMPGPGE